VVRRIEGLGELQHAIMTILWERGEASSADVHRALFAERRLAPTTIATMLRKMEDRELVTHRASGRQFLYAAQLTEKEVRRSAVKRVVDRLFEGDPMALVSHLVSEREIDQTELEQLKRRVDIATQNSKED